MPNRSAETELEETEKVALIARPRGKHSRLCLKGCAPPPPAPPEVDSEELYGVKEQRVISWGPFPACWVVR